MPPLEFQINITGNLQGELKAAGKEFDAAEGHAKNAAHGVELFEGEVGRLKGGLAGLELNFSALAKGGPLFTFDLAEGLRTVYEIAEKVVDTFIDLGKEVIKVAGETQDLNLAIKLNVGDEQAEKINQLAESFQRTTRFSAADIKKSILPLLQQGLGGNVQQLDDLTTAATDYAARTNTGVEGVRTALESFGNIALRGQVNFRMLKNLRISEASFNKDLADLLHTDTKGAQRLMKEGKVGKESLLSVALHQLAGQQGGAIGAPSTKAATTLGATLERLGKLKENLFERIAETPGMKKIQQFLDHIVDVLGGSTGTAIVEKLSSGLAGVVGFIEGAWPHVVSGFEFAKSVVTDLITAFSPLISAVFDIGGGILKFTIALASALHLGDLFKEIWSETLNLIHEIGVLLGNIVQGFREIIDLGRQLKSGRVFTDIADTITGNKGGIAGGAVNENSPLWKRVPKMAAGGVVTEPTLALIGEAGPEAVVPLSGGGGRAITFSPHIEVHGGGANAADTANQIAETIRIEFRRLIAEAAA